MMERDFTLKKYKKLCDAIVASGYTTITMAEYLSNKETYKDTNFVIMRHDIDNKVDLSITQKMAEYEQSLEMKASHYFRTVEDVFDGDIIREVASRSHEVGYHYEVL